MDLLSCLLIAAASAHVVALGALVHVGRATRWRRATGFLGWCLLASGFGFALSTRLAPTSIAVGSTFVVTAACCVYAFIRRHELELAGALVWSSLLLLGAFGGVRAVVFIAHMDVSATTLVLLWAGVPFVAIGIPASVVTQRESLEVLIRRRWRHQYEPLVEPDRDQFPFVSIQVPCHAEPPHVVVGTLDCLAALDYPAFEVLVIDNNTTDPALWRPVEAHCRALGPRFRFLHVEGIEGAKAGALNWASTYINPTATLIALVDADYHVDRRWLRSTVGFLEDDQIAFVQPPHAYRDWNNRRFGRMANWEYSMFFTTGMVALQEHEAGLTVGTMSVIRRDALERAGGWAEWCLTEDSELAIRLHVLGYRSIYLREPLGWGLIPDTFDGYRKQRFRWTYGPVQELRHHWRRYLPARLGGAPALTTGQRTHHANHGLDVAMIGIRLLSWPVALAAAVSLLAHGEHVAVPLDLWIAASALLASGVVIRWMQYCRITGASLREAFGAVVAYQALGHTIAVASLLAVTGRPASWHRTDKFRVARRRRRALATTRIETIIATVMILAATILLATTRGGLTAMLGIGFAVQGLGYACTPAVALIAEHDLDPEHPTVQHAQRAFSLSLEETEQSAVSRDRQPVKD